MSLTLFFLLLLVAVLFAALLRTRTRARRLEQEHFIRSYVFSNDLLHRLIKHHSHLEEKDIFLVARGLREFFIIHIRAGQQLIGMPSKVVDDLWHEFILDTRVYESFCKGAFTSYFHHVPASTTKKGIDMDSALRVTWRYACLEENISTKNATRLPLLFAIDEKLKIENGNKYNLRSAPNRLQNSGGCGGTACGGGLSYAEGDSSGCSEDGGDGGGGGGCGGGCGGG